MNNLILGGQNDRRSLRSVVARALGWCPSEDRVVDVINESQERLLNREDDPVGSLVVYQFCARNYCLVLPRQVRTVTAYEVCGTPGTVSPLWWRFHANGPGQLCATSTCAMDLVDRGIAVAFSEVAGVGKYVRVYAQNGVDAGRKIILKYYREDTKFKQYSSINGTVQEGEQLTLVAPPLYAVTSTTVMPGGLYGVIRETTQYPVNLYEFDGSGNTQTLAQYEPSETVPTYRKIFLPGITEQGGCAQTCQEGCPELEDDQEACDDPIVTTLVKLQHVPALLDNDPLVIGNVAAFKLMSMAIQREGQERFEEAQHLEAKAVRELRGELASYMGAGQVSPVQVQSRDTYGIGGSAFAYDYWGGW